MPDHPNVFAQLTGRDGNAFAIIGAVCEALQRAGHTAAAADYQTRAFNAQSYDDLLRLTVQTVEVA